MLERNNVVGINPSAVGEKIMMEKRRASIEVSGSATMHKARIRYLREVDDNV
jgi:hypothetical protein